MMLLYTHPLSANAHKVVLLLGYLGLRHDAAIIDIPTGEQKGAAFVALNPLGQIPLLTDGDVTLRDAQAILIYVAARYGRDRWWPVEAAEQGLVTQWLIFAALEQQNSINLARLHFRLGQSCDLNTAQAWGRQTMAQLDAHLVERDWLELGHPTIADCACAPFAARSVEAGIALTDYPHVAAWLERLRALPGFAGMEGFD